MLDLSIAGEPRRRTPRAPANALCEVHSWGAGQPALVVDVSESGIKLHRPIGARSLPRGLVPLELELPGIDEVVWVAGEVCFREIKQISATEFGLSGFVRTSGIHLVSLADRHRRLLRDFSREYAARALAAARQNPLMLASCYHRG